MFPSPEFIAADAAYRRERMKAAYYPKTERRTARRHRWHSPFGKSNG